MIPFPAFRQAIRDRRVRKGDLVVFDAALEELDFEEYRYCKQALLAKRTGIRETHVGRSLRRLARFGYLDRREVPRQAEREYRLRLNRRNGENPPVVSSQVA